MSNFYIPDFDMALTSDPEGYGAYYQTTASQSTPSILYSPPLQQTVQSLPVEHSHTQQYYPQHHHSYPGPIPTYSAQSTWPPQQTMAPAPMSYSSYAQSIGNLAPTTSYYPTASPRVPTRPSRSHSAASLGSYTMEDRRAAYSRSASPNAPDLREYGVPNNNGTWTCAYPGCTSKAVFTRGCDLRKHYKRHTKSFFCRHEGCPQSTGGGFSSKKDLARHEAKHNPGISCDWSGCDRVFSRVDNMRDHVKRIHQKGSRSPPKHGSVA